MGFYSLSKDKNFLYFLSIFKLGLLAYNNSKICSHLFNVYSSYALCVKNSLLFFFRSD
nr:MAG TPA: hypothetical protein [Caudoviricetes sp.]